MPFAVPSLQSYSTMQKHNQQKSVVDKHSDTILLSEDEDLKKYDGCVPPHIMRKKLKSKIMAVKGDKKLAFAGLYQLYHQQNVISEEEEHEIQLVKYKFRLRSENLLNKARKIISGESPSNDIISSSELLTEEDKLKELKNISIPNFWPTVIKKSSFQNLIHKAEQDAIDNIKDIFVSLDISNNKLSVEIHFEENPVFSDRILKATLVQVSQNNYQHTFDSPKFKADYTNSKFGFLNIFTTVQNEDLTGLYQYWYNFYQLQLPEALTFYFSLRQGDVDPKIPNLIDDQYLEESDDEAMAEEQAIQTKKPAQSQKSQSPNASSHD